MARTPTQYLATAVLVLCCLLVACGAGAQGVAQEAMWEADELGLTPDQKTKIEAIQKDVQSQMQAVIGDTKLEGDERGARLRGINETERARVSEVLTPAQQQKLKDLMWPKERWHVGGYITAGTAPAHYTVHVDGWPSEYLSYTIRKQNIRLSALDADRKPVPNGPRLALAPGVPDVIVPVLDRQGSSTCQVEFVLDRETAKPGLYVFEFRAAVDATDAETNERVKLRDAVASQRVYVTPQPDQEPALRPGQRFIGTPWEEASATTVSPYRDLKSDRPITWGEIATRIATLQRVEPKGAGHRLVFVLEKHTGQVYLETELQAPDLPYLTPLLTEPTLRALKAQYEGKQVWCYGGPGAQCVSTEPGMSISMCGSVDVPLRIRRVERVYRPGTQMAVGRATFLGGERGSAFVADNPLVVILEAPAKGLEFNGLSYWGDKDISDGVSMNVVSDPRAHCLGLWNTVSDRWDFEREYSLCSPFRAHPEWLASMRKAVLKGAVVKGMTREMVAWARGWPSMYGTKKDMLSIDDWAYDNIPFQGHIYFKNGRMVDEYWPRLP